MIFVLFASDVFVISRKVYKKEISDLPELPLGDMDGFLDVTLLLRIRPIYQNLQNMCRTQWARVGNNIDYRYTRFVYG